MGIARKTVKKRAYMVCRSGLRRNQLVTGEFDMKKIEKELKKGKEIKKKKTIKDKITSIFLKDLEE